MKTKLKALIFHKQFFILFFTGDNILNFDMLSPQHQDRIEIHRTERRVSLTIRKVKHISHPLSQDIENGSQRLDVTLRQGLEEEQIRRKQWWFRAVSETQRERDMEEKNIE